MSSEKRLFCYLIVTTVFFVVFIMSLFHMYEAGSVISLIDIKQQVNLPLVHERVYQLISANERVQSFAIAFLLALVFTSYQSFSLYRNIARSKKSILDYSRLIGHDLSCKNDLIEIISTGVEAAIVILDDKNRYLWSNSKFNSLFTYTPRIKQECFDKFIIEKLTNVEANGGIKGAVQIKNIMDTDFVLRRHTDASSLNSVYTFFPLKLYFAEYLEGQSTDGLYEVLGDNVFDLLSLVDESLISVSSQFVDIRYEQPTTKFPVMIRAEEKHFADALETLSRSVFFIANKSNRKSISVDYSAAPSNHKLSFKVNNLEITQEVLEDNISGKSVGMYFGVIEDLLKEFDGKVLIKNVQCLEQGNFASVELSFKRAVNSSAVRRSDEVCNA